MTGNHANTRQARTAQPGSPFAPPVTMATSWAAGFIASGSPHPSTDDAGVKRQWDP